MFEQSKPGTTAEVPTVKINIPENDDILRCPAASDGENVSHCAFQLSVNSRKYNVNLLVIWYLERIRGIVVPVIMTTCTLNPGL